MQFSVDKFFFLLAFFGFVGCGEEDRRAIERFIRELKEYAIKHFAVGSFLWLKQLRFNGFWGWNWRKKACNDS